MPIDNTKNFAKATVSQGYSAAATSITLETGGAAKMPTPPFNATWWNSSKYPDPADDPNVEIVRVTAIVGEVLTIVRGQESTSASAKNTSGKTYKLIAGPTSKLVTDIVGELAEKADADTLNASNLTSGTIPAGRFPAVLPAVSGANLTNLPPATDLGWYNIVDYGAAGNGVTDDTSAIQDAIDACPEFGTVYIPVGNFLLSGGGTELLLIEKNVSLVGEHGYGSNLSVKSDVGSSTDVIRVSPPTGSRFQRLTNFRVSPQSGTPSRHTINLDITDVGQYMVSMLIDRLFLDNFGPAGYSIKLTNPTNNDGFTLSSIIDNQICGGIYLQRCGDSVYVERNVFYGIGGPSRPAIEMSVVPGAARIIFRDNNSTMDGGFLLAHSGVQLVVENNQIENFDPTSSAHSAQVILLGDEAAHSACSILRNNLNAHNNCSHNVLVGNAHDTEIDANFFHQPTAQAIKINAGALRTRIGKNMNVSTVSDSGTGTIEDVFEAFGGGPAFVSGAVLDADPNVVIVTLSEEVKAPDYEAGMTISINGDPASISSAARQSDKTKIHYTISPAVVAADEVTADYEALDGFIQSEAGIQLESFSEDITNSVIDPGTILIQDQFTDSNGTLLSAHTMNIGTGWLVSLGGSPELYIQSNKASTANDTATTRAHHTESNYSNAIVRIKFTVETWTSGFGSVLLLLRQSSLVNTENGYLVYITNDPPGSISLYKVVGGTLSLLDSASVTLTSGAENTLIATLSGNSISVDLNSVVVDATDSFNATATKHGFGGQGLLTTITFDDFEVVAI